MTAWRRGFALFVFMTAVVKSAIAQTAVSGHTAALVPQRDWESPVRTVGTDKCRGDHFIVSTTVGGLPAEVRELIAQDGRVADRDDRWGYSDVVGPGDLDLPHFRMPMAAIGLRKMFVVIQQGGGPIITTIWRFERPNTKWTLAQKIQGGVEPVSLDELIYEVCSDRAKPPPRR